MRIIKDGNVRKLQQKTFTDKKQQIGGQSKQKGRFLDIIKVSLR